jgi:DivIVA domain-containing protein
MNVEDITNRTFDAVLHGYDKAEVRDFLSEVAAEYGAVLSRVNEADANLEALRDRLERLDEVVRSSDGRHREAEARIAELEAEKLTLVAAAPATPDDAAKQVGEEVTSVLQAAVAAGQSIRAEAESWAAQLRREVREDVDSRLAEARQEMNGLIEREQETLERLRTNERELRKWLREARSSIDEALKEPGLETQDLRVPDSFVPALSQCEGDLSGASSEDGWHF